MIFLVLKIFVQLFLGEKELQNQMYHLECHKIMNGYYVMQKETKQKLILKEKEENIMKLLIFLEDHGELMI